MPKAILVAIGDEILKGYTLNTNIHFLSQLLTKHGYAVSEHLSIADDPGVLKSAISAALERADVVITTGGLGPTIDDLTKATLVELMGFTLEYNEEVAEEIRRRYGKIDSIKHQSMLPKGAPTLKNRIGTAWGMVMDRLISLPGVPSEMRQIATEEMIPYLLKTFPPEGELHTREMYVTLKHEGEIDPYLRAHKNDRVQVGIYPAYRHLTVRMSSENEEALEQAVSHFSEEFATFLYTSYDGSIEAGLKELMAEKRLTLSTAESCTGGLIASKITRIPGSSEYYIGGLVTYCNEQKEKMLGVSPDTLEKHGAVSKETVIEMARGLLAMTGSDYGIAISGIAGPDGGSEEKPVGTVYAAIASLQGIEAGLIPIKSRADRELIQLNACNFLLGALYCHIKYNANGFFLEE